MLRVAALSIVVATLSGCAYNNPTLPTQAPISDVAPAFLTLGVPPTGSGLVTAYVQNAHGAPLSGIVVQFRSTSGEVSPSAAQTGSDGRASATVTAANDAHVTATVGTLTANAIVPVSTTSTPTPTPTPTPSPGPSPTPPAPSPSVFLNVSNSATTGVPLVFGVSSTATGVTWLWNFGDGVSAQTTAFSTAHTYGAAGIYTATVSSAGTPSASATIVVSDPSAPAPPASSAGLVISLTCTPANHGPTTPTSCNVSASYHGASLFSTAITKVDWDWGDGSSQITLFPNAAPVASHPYVQAGTYLIVPNVTATTVDGPKMATTSKTVVIP